MEEGGVEEERRRWNGMQKSLYKSTSISWEGGGGVYEGADEEGGLRLFYCHVVVFYRP